MDKNLVVRVLESARRYRDSSIDYDPLVKEGYTDQQIGNAIQHCEEQGYLLTVRNERKNNRYMPSENDGWWLRGLSRKGGEFLDEEFVDVNKLEHDYI